MDKYYNKSMFLTREERVIDVALQVVAARHFESSAKV